MRLSDGKKNRYYVVEQINMDNKMKLRLRGLGLTPDTRLQLVHRKHCGTVIIWARGTRLALGSKVAELIQVKETDGYEKRESGAGQRGRDKLFAGNGECGGSRSFAGTGEGGGSRSFAGTGEGGGSRSFAGTGEGGGSRSFAGTGERGRSRPFAGTGERGRSRPFIGTGECERNKSDAAAIQAGRKTLGYGPEQRQRNSYPSELTVGLIGNPNCGKTTLFNALTGAHVKVANWPGVTVERTEGRFIWKGISIKLVDLPGVYSLDTGSMEERISAGWLESGEPDVVVNVVNATALERNLYLTVQLLERRIPVVTALNLMDVAEEQGMKIRIDRLSEGLGGIPVIPISARTRRGLTDLKDGILTASMAKRADFGSTRPSIPLNEDNRVQYPSANDRYSFTEKLASQVISEGGKRHGGTDRADRVFAHPILGIPVFCLLMAAVFTLTFMAGDWVKGYLENALDWLTEFGKTLFFRIGVADWMASLVFNGIVTGVGGILTFLPNLLILYLSLALLEDSGYMARAAYVMNETMGLLGLSGKAFLPILLGFGCTVPAAAATEGLENQQEKQKVLRVLPFISCSAKLPVYILFAGAFFGNKAVVVTYGLCAAGAVLGMMLGWMGDKLGGREERTVLLLELPDYRWPDGRTVGLYVWEKVKDYLNRAGTIIFLTSMILWFLLNYGPGGVTGPGDSFAAIIGKFVAPVFAPAGFGVWQLCVALIAGLSAKEVVVSASMVLFNVEHGASLPGTDIFRPALVRAGLTPAGTLAFLTFCLLYSPCAAAVAAINRESGSGRWTMRLVFWQTLLAWGIAVAVYQAGRFFGS